MNPARRIGIALALLTAPGVARADAWHVPGDADTIAEALAFAAEWDTIIVEAGAYTREPAVRVTYSIQIESLDGAEVEYPSFIVDGATLRLSTGVLVGDEYLSLTGSSYGDLYAAVFVDDGTFEGHELTIYGGYGYGVFGVDASVDLEGGSVRDASLAYGVKVVGDYEGVQLALQDVELTNNLAGAVSVYDPTAANYTTVSVVDSVFYGNATTGYGSDLSLYYVDVATVSGSSFEGGWALLGGGAITAYESSLAISGASTFSDNMAPSAGSIDAFGYSSGLTLDVSDTTFQGGYATDAGGAGGEISAEGVEVTLQRVRANGSSATYGGFLFQSGGSVRMSDTDIWNASAETGGAVLLYPGSIGLFNDVSFCGNTASYAAALYAASSTVSLENSLVQANESWYGTVIEMNASELTLLEDTIVGNRAPLGNVVIAAANASVIDTIFVNGPAGLTVGTDAVVTEAGYNLYWDLDYAEADYSTLGGDVFADPRFVSSFDPATCGTIPWLAPDSPAIDAGHPDRTDPDLSRADIGAFAAEPEPDDTGVVDTGPDDTGPVDTGVVDTGPDDTDPDPDDTGAAAPDADGDGTPDAEDCAPEDPERHPGAFDDPTDTVDQDCDGDAASGIARGGCGCDHGGGALPGLAALGALALAVSRRRRSA